MAHVITPPPQNHLPLDSDGVCMLCQSTPDENSTLTCTTCATTWHVACLKSVPETLAFALKFECPDCTGAGNEGPVAGGELVEKIREIERDEKLSEGEKAKRRQELLSGKGKGKAEEEEEEEENEGGEEYDVLKVLHESFKCCFCMQLPERPVTVYDNNNNVYLYLDMY